MKMSLAQFLDSISIQSANESTWDLIISEGYDTLEEIRNMSWNNFAEIGRESGKTIGQNRGNKIFDSLHSDRVRPLLDRADVWAETSAVKPEVVEVPVSDAPVEGMKMDLRGKKIVMTGEGPAPRSVLQGYLKSLGVEIQASVTKETDVLIMADPQSQTSKAKKARALGVTLVAYSEVF